jgi:hypothetical protein
MGGPWWLDPPAETSEVVTGAVGTVERVLGLLGEEAALRRARPAASASRGPSAGAKDEAGAAVGTASRAHGRGRRHSRRADRQSRLSRGEDPGRGAER